MTTAIIPLLVAMSLGNTFNLAKYEKGNADVFDASTLKGNEQVIDRSFTRSQYKLIETSTQAREFLDVSGVLSLRIKQKTELVDGIGGYLKNIENREKFVELLVRVQHETITKTIPSHLKPKLDWMSMSSDLVGTHYVRSLTYGGELVASLQFKANNREEREKIKAAISTNLQLTGTFDLNANGSFDKLKQDLAGMYNVVIKVMGTRSPSSPPQSVEELMKFVEDYPKAIQAADDGKGQPIKAELFPLSSLKADFPNYLPNSAINSLLNDIETKYDDIRTVQQDIVPWNIEVGDMSDEEDKMVEELYSALDKAQTAFHKAINNLDASINGKVDQFAEAFEAYGKGKENIPNRFQRWFWKLRHIIAKEPIVWKKPAGSGAVYINWGSKKCPTLSLTTPDVETLYEGRATGSLLKAWGGGRNYECFQNWKPSLSDALNPQPKTAYVDAVYFRALSDAEKIQPIECAACLVQNTLAVQAFHGRTSCPKNWRKEYSGYAMADSASNIDMDFMCLNKESGESWTEDTGNDSMSKVNPVWMNCKDCNGDKIVPCVVCSYENKASVF